MPELPEVEIARRNLTSWLRGGAITVARAPDRVVLRGGAPSAFARALVGRVVREVSRRGKWLRLELAEGGYLFSHLGMTGKWVLRGAEEPELDWERARLDVVIRGHASSARYVDPRRFGRLVVAEADIAEWRALGPDPLVDGIDAKQLAVALARRRGAVKDALLDQSVLAGIGNIHATEALWMARIDPRSRCDALTLGDIRAVARGLRKSIARTLDDEDGPEVWYLQEAGAPNPFPIYGHAGEPCPRCAVSLVRVVLGGRGTTFCPACQVRRA